MYMTSVDGIKTAWTTEIKDLARKLDRLRRTQEREEAALRHFERQAADAGRGGTSASENCEKYARKARATAIERAAVAKKLAELRERLSALESRKRVADIVSKVRSAVGQQRAQKILPIATYAISTV